jgi:hypothetical protein
MSGENTTEYPFKVDLSDRHYYYFVAATTSTWAACFVLILVPRILVYLCNRPEKRDKNSVKADQILVEPSFYSSVQNWAEDLISGNTTTGRILVVFAFTCSIASFVVYIIGKLICHVHS